MLITYRGRQYDTASADDVELLAATAPGIGSSPIHRVLSEACTQREIDGAVWAELLWQGPGSLTAHEQGGGAR